MAKAFQEHGLRVQAAPIGSEVLNRPVADTVPDAESRRPRKETVRRRHHGQY
jgi:hypothetical protein